MNEPSFSISLTRQATASFIFDPSFADVLKIPFNFIASYSSAITSISLLVSLGHYSSFRSSSSNYYLITSSLTRDLDISANMSIDSAGKDSSDICTSASVLSEGKSTLFKRSITGMGLPSDSCVF